MREPAGGRDVEEVEGERARDARGDAQRDPPDDRDEQHAEQVDDPERDGLRHVAERVQQQRLGEQQRRGGERPRGEGGRRAGSGGRACAEPSPGHRRQAPPDGEEPAGGVELVAPGLQSPRLLPGLPATALTADVS